MNRIADVYLRVASQLGAAANMIKLNPEPTQAYKRAQRRNEERFRTRRKTALAGMEGDHASPASRKKADQGGKKERPGKTGQGFASHQQTETKPQENDQ